MVSEKDNFYANLEYKDKDYTNLKSYCLSKLANIHFTQALVQRCHEKYPNVKIVSLHPGVVIT